MTPFFMLTTFVIYLETEKRYSAHTLVAYTKDLQQFLDFSDIRLEQELDEVNHHLIRSWVVHLHEQAYENKTINRKLASLRSYYRWLLKNGIVKQNPCLKIKGPKQQKKLPIFAKESEITPERLAHLFTDDVSGKRDQLIFEVLYQTGIRLSELIALKKEDVGRRQIKVLGKRQKERLIPISPQLYEQLMLYTESDKHQLKTGDYLFTLDTGEKLYPKFVYRKINYYLSLVANLDVNSPHVLRHTFATHLLNNGAGLETLKDLLGHASLAATQVYTHNSFAQLNKIYSSAHPRGHKTN